MALFERYGFGVVVAALAGAILAAPSPAAAQRAGVPRTTGGRPDLSGIWQALSPAEWDLEGHSARLNVPAGQSVVEDGDIPYLASALAQRRKNGESAAEDPVKKCYLPGVPRATYMPFPFQIVQTSKYIGVAYEFAHATRILYLDGTKHPEGDIDFWMGDSRAHWDGDTLVVDVANLNDQTWLDEAGNYHSGALHVVERYTLTNKDHILYTATIEDPKVFARPWTISMPLYRRVEKNIQLLDYECVGYVQHAAATR